MAPGFIANAITFTPAPPPSIDPTLFSNVYGTMNQSNRHGGYTLVRPQNFQVYLNNALFNNANGVFAFKNTPITSGAVEGYYLMTQNEMDNYGVDPNSDVSVNILNSAYASPFLPQSDNIVANMNTPPYYVPNTVQYVCPVLWSGASANFGEVCGTSQPWYIGVAEYLSNYNYAPANMSMGVGVGQVFQAMAIHQRIYANLMNAFPDMSSAGLVSEDNLLAQIQYQMQNYNATATGGTNNNACSATGVNNSTGCGANWAPASSSIFKNWGNCSSNIPKLYWYDPMLWWETQSGSRSKPTLWTLHSMWATEPTPPADPGGAADGPEGPNCGASTGTAGGWNGASLALVYAWDQPNFPGSPVGPGFYPTYPLIGGQTYGDPGY
ncbi:MAG: hypothetical protein JO199_13445 [Candidatus Eremiobacteraeota bacterium]|nr:hypothetical protein [Candidatus Eremiobacteraeota bacterium]